MKGLYGKKHFDIQLRRLPEREAAGHMVRIGVRACGVCGTDLHFLREMDEYTPMGHEISAVVREIGPEVTRVKVGDSVICEDVSPCGACPSCKTGQYRLCRSGYNLDGQPGMADEMVVHENMLNPFEGIDPVTASMVEPLAVAIRGVTKLALRPFASLAIFGMGAIGLLSAAYARAMGAGRIAMVARDPDSLRNRAAAAAAADLGADEVHYSGKDGYLEEMLKGGAFDAAIVAAPPSLCGEAMRVVGYGGNVLCQGVTFGGDPFARLDVSAMVLNKNQLLTSFAEPAENFPLSIQMIRSGRVDAGRIITHRVPLTGTEKLAGLYGNDAPAIKTVILCGE
ncbi:MAG: alcohol dehydrogenase catalytic domain-containing protein [Clostridia bacterium]|nr:alcohol dehydrogenase catalytic domain-containing protein [Clostridia bacterium]